MYSISANESSEKSLIHAITNFCEKYSVGAALKKSNAYKKKGVPVMNIFLYLVQLVYTGKSMYMNQRETNSRTDRVQKDTVYRLMNASFINWSRFLITVAQCFITDLNSLTSEERLNAYVIDDTLYSRLRSKKVELMAKVHDHTGKGAQFRKGFRMLTLSWTDGNTLVPIAFRFHGEKKTAGQIYRQEKKRRGKSKYLLSVDISVYSQGEETVDARLVYVRDRSNKKKWIAIICTDMSLTEEEIIAMYGKRWSIEVFFKICKS